MAITLAAVCTGTKYGPEYVERLVSGVRRHLSVDRVLLLHDHDRFPAIRLDGIEYRNIAHLGLPGWWAKMALLDPAVRGQGRCLFLDLDMVPIAELAPVAAIESKFAICGSFARAAGNLRWPCKYGSCAMVFAEGWGERFWKMFWTLRAQLMAECPKGDQQAIERLIPNATLLQPLLPAGFFLHYRELEHYPLAPPALARIVVFGGSHKPHNSTLEWVRGAWCGRALAH